MQLTWSYRSLRQTAVSMGAHNTNMQIYEYISKQFYT